MNRKTLIAAALGGASLLGMSTLAQAVPAVVAPSQPPTVIMHNAPARTIVLQSAPPPAVYESVPAPRSGYVWAPGHYEWRDGRYAWAPGRWIDDRPGSQWQEARWLQRTDGTWYLVGGQWITRGNNLAQDDARYGRDPRGVVRRGPNGDRDGDGIANRDDRDRDGDGVRNSQDDYPNDPLRD